MQEVNWTPMLWLRIGSALILLVLMLRATYFRIRSWLYSRYDTDPMVRDMREDRLLRIVCKHVINFALLATLWGRFFLPLEQRYVWGDGLLGLIALALTALLVIDEIYVARIVRHAREHDQMESWPQYK